MKTIMKSRARLAVLAATAAGLVGIAGPALAATNSVVVNESSLSNGWTLYADNGGTGAFVNGPATPPAGTGSFQFHIPSNGKVTLYTHAVAGQPLSAVDTVSYSTYRASTSTMANNVDPSLNMEICTGGIVGGNCSGYTTLVWEPVYAYGTAANSNNPVVDDTWQTWNALDHTSTSYGGGWWSTHAIPGVPQAFNSFVSLGAIQDANPDAVILSFGVNVGHGPAGTFDGNADALTLGLNGNTTVYDLEHAVSLAGKDECKDNGWMTSTSPTFTNQGDCVSFFASNGKTHPDD